MVSCAFSVSDLRAGFIANRVRRGRYRSCWLIQVRPEHSRSFVAVLGRSRWGRGSLIKPTPITVLVRPFMLNGQLTLIVALVIIEKTITMDGHSFSLVCAADTVGHASISTAISSPKSGVATTPFIAS